MSDTVTVLVGQRWADKFDHRWYRLKGEKVSSYEDEKGVTYTLYRYTDPGYANEAYRVHVADETDSKNPTYELRPSPEDRSPYSRRDIADEYPRFIKDMRPLERAVYPID